MNPVSAKMAQDAPKMAQGWPQVAPRWPHDGPKVAPRWQKDGPKMAQARGGYGLGVQVFREALARCAPALRAQYSGRACEVLAVLSRKDSFACKRPGLARCLVACRGSAHSAGPAHAAPW